VCGNNSEPSMAKREIVRRRTRAIEKPLVLNYCREEKQAGYLWTIRMCRALILDAAKSFSLASTSVSAFGLGSRF
jgi:hypothetical protein